MQFDLKEGDIITINDSPARVCAKKFIKVSGKWIEYNEKEDDKLEENVPFKEELFIVIKHGEGEFQTEEWITLQEFALRVDKIDSTQKTFDPINDSFDPDPNFYKSKGINNEQVEILVNLEEEMNELYRKIYLSYLENDIEGWSKEIQGDPYKRREDIERLRFMVQEKMGIRRRKYKTFWQLGEISQLEVENGKVVGLFLYTYYENYFLSTIPEVLGKLKSLKKLTMHGRGGFGIKEVPKFITKLINLEHLNLAGNSLNYIPKFLCKLPKLKHLDLRGNYIRENPEFFDNKNDLEILYKWE